MSVDFYGPALNIEELIASGARGFIASVDDVDPVTVVSDILHRDSLLPQPGWTDIGSAREGQGSSYEQNITTTELRVEQSTAVVFENISEVVRTITHQYAELTPAKLGIIEESTPTTGAEWSVEGGSITSRARYRVAILGLREPGNGRDITDSAGNVRGELFGVCLQHAALSADSKTFELQRGQLANMPVAWKGYPDPDTSSIVIWVGETGPVTLPAGS